MLRHGCCHVWVTCAIQQDPIPNFLTFKPDFATNRLHIKLNYTHSGLLFSDLRCTIASTLGFSDDMLVTTERYVGLEATAITVDIMWRKATNQAWSQFAATLPAQPSRGYTATQIKNDLNTIVEDYLYQNHQVGPATSPWNAMISNIQVLPGTQPHTYQIKTDYTNETLVKVRGDMYDNTDTSSLPNGHRNVLNILYEYIYLGISCNTIRRYAPSSNTYI